MMQMDAVRSMHEYNRWAMEKTLDVAANLSKEQFLAEDDTPWCSIRNQFVHICNVHRGWLSWIDGSLPPEEAYRLQDPLEDFPDVASVRRFWERVWEQTDAYFQNMPSGDLERLLVVEWPGVEFQVPVWKVLAHLANHGMQHRTELTMSLTRLGYSPGDLDYIFFELERSGQAVW